MPNRRLMNRSASATAIAPSPTKSVGPVRLVDVRDREPEPLEKVNRRPCQLAGQSQQVLDLVEHDQEGRPEREADDHRVRDEPREVAQSQERDPHLDRADQKGQHDRQMQPLGVRKRNQRALNTAIEMALVGPLMSCRDESNSAPTPVMTMAVYSPYCGGRPAICA